MLTPNHLFHAQKVICERYGATFSPCSFDGMIGIALASFPPGSEPIHGLRHPEQNQSSGWFLWCGEYSEADDFFQSVHIHHLQEIYPPILSYLGLPPGWRFLIDEEYEDVWYDKSLLDV